MEVAPDGKLVITACRVEPSKTDADRECVRWCHGLARPTSTARRHATAEPSGTSVSAEARESASRQHSARRSLIPSIRRRSAARRAVRRATPASHRWSGWSRSEERPGRTACVSSCSTRRSPNQEKNTLQEYRRLQKKERGHSY